MNSAINRKNASLVAEDLLNRYDQASDIPEDDPTLLILRKWFRPRRYEKKVRKPYSYYTFDTERAQELLDSGKFKQDISDELGIGQWVLNDRIKKGILSDKKWLEEINNRLPKYRLMYDRRIQMVGTINEIRNRMNYTALDIERLSHKSLGLHIEKIKDK
ncbi:hypothetical protein [Companilactobacillus keshanensis]|uniref:MerR family transcriptional regulator n=1 Tax=Companilactobacillus keshanensis TaxID=2486003 RepID=A0ABW4BV66_9LACO|nr:hypothetical protein [Companilactobacillus keshanensis]